MSRCLIGVGANLGDPEASIAEAARRMRLVSGVRLVAESPLLETPAAGGPSGQPAYRNAAWLLETSRSPDDLFGQLLEIERQLGRLRTMRWAARTIDLDLLLVDSQILRSGPLVLPHPRMAFRRFVIEPAAQIAPQMIHPTIGWTIGQLLAHLQAPETYVAIVGPPGAGKSRLAAEVARSSGARFFADPPDRDKSEANELPPRDPSGRAAERGIEWVRRRADLLASARWTSGDPPIITDFWLDPSYVCSSLALADAERAKLAAAALQAHNRIATPKLIVWYEPELARSTLRDTLYEAVGRPGVGPVLWLEGIDFGEAVAEVSAAIVAMQ